MDNNRLGYERHRGLRGAGFMTRLTGAAGAVVGLVLLITVLVFGFMVSLIVIPVILIVAAATLGYFWFKTRGIRKELQEQMQAFRETLPGERPGDLDARANRGAGDGEVIDGDQYIHETGSEQSARQNKN